MNFKQLDLLKIVKPIWYYYLNYNENKCYWIDYKKLTKNDQQLINYCDQYSSQEVALIDAAYQAWNRGFIDPSGKTSMEYKKSINIPINDQYRFIRRMFKPIWIYYALCIRLITFNNPFRELRAYFQTKNVDKIDLNNFDS